MAATHHSARQRQHLCASAHSLGVQCCQLCFLHRHQRQSIQRLSAVRQHQPGSSEGAAALGCVAHCPAGSGVAADLMVCPRPLSVLICLFQVTSLMTQSAAKVKSLHAVVHLHAHFSSCTLCCRWVSFMLLTVLPQAVLCCKFW